MSGGNATPRGTGAECRKFAPNIFNKSKCSSCFKQKEEHSAEALECNRATRKISKCGYLFVAPGWDFSNPLNRTKDEDTSILELQSLLVVEWMDERLKWDPTLFDNITKMPVPFSRIWVPELYHRGEGTADSKKDMYDLIQCFVREPGRVSCLLTTVNNIRCDTDFTRWPYDRQNCTLVLALWSHGDEQFNLAPMQRDPVSVNVFSPNQEWSLDVTRVSRDKKPTHFSDTMTVMALTIDFVLDRTTDCLRGQFVSPTIILMITTIITAYLEPSSFERITIACLNIIIHLLCIQNLNWILPHNGITVPNILLFYCDSMIMAVVALVLTFVFGKIQTTNRRPPKCIVTIVVALLRNKYGQAFMLSIFEIGDPKPAAEVEAAADDDNNALVDADANSKKLVWRYVTVLLLRLTCCIYIVIYVVMYVVLIMVSPYAPTSSPIGVA